MRRDVVNDTDGRYVYLAPERHEDVLAEQWLFELAKLAPVKAGAGDRLPRVGAKLLELLVELGGDRSFLKFGIQAQPPNRQKCIALQRKVVTARKIPDRGHRAA